MRKIIFIVLLSITGGYIKSQNVGISSGGSTPRDCAMLDILSSNTGLLIPNLALTANNVYLPAIGTAVDGLLIYNTATAGGITSTAVLPGYYYWSTSASKWVALSGNGSKDWGLLGNAGITQPATPATYGTSTLGATENWMGTTDGNDVVFGTNAIERMRLFSSGQLSIGSSLVGAKLNVHQTTATAVGRFTTYGNTNDIELRRAQGTQAAPTATSGTGTVLGRLFAQGYDGATYTSAASISMETDAAGGTSTDMPGRIVFNTTLDGTGTPLVERMRITNAGFVGIGTSAPSTLFHVDGGTGSTTQTIATITGNSLSSGTGLLITSNQLITGNLLYVEGTNAGSFSGNGIESNMSGASGATYAIYGLTASTTGTGVIGKVTATTGVNWGVYGKTFSKDGYGVLGWNASTTAPTAKAAGIYGEADAPGAIGVWAIANDATNTSQSYGLWAETHATSAIGVVGMGNGLGFTALASGAGGYFRGTTYGAYSTATASGGTGVYGEATFATGINTGVWGHVSSTSNTAAGVWGDNGGVSGVNYGVFGGNSSTAGYGVYGQGIRYGTYGIETDVSTAGTGYLNGNTYAGVMGYTSITTLANAYHFGVHGVANCAGTIGTDSRTGGVLGDRESGSWGSLGYRSSTPTDYGVYATAALTTGAGRYSSGSTLLGEKSNMGIGIFGDLMGGWIRGNVYGMNLKGERYSLYVDGKQYTNDIITQISNNGTEPRTVSYASTSTSVDIYTRGSGKLENGKATISFDGNYSSQLSPQEKVMVTITPTGPSNGVYVMEISSKGFMVVENNNGTSNAEFSWIAVGVRKGYEKPEHPKELLSSDYDEKMKGVMFNENDLQNSGTPIWWDGTQLRFDSPPEGVKQETQQPAIPKKEVPVAVPATDKKPIEYPLGKEKAAVSPGGTK